ncbi:rod shape-determining protein MreC [bacterium]|nr:rod shape-determining protein MreC [bacterium]
MFKIRRFIIKFKALVRSNKKLAVFGLGTVTVCFLALYIHQHRNGRTGRVDNALTWVTGNLQENTGFFARGLQKISDHYVLLVNTARKNEVLELEIAEAKQKLTQLQEVEASNRRLSSLLDFKTGLSMKTVAAKVIAHDISPDFLGIRIDRGSRDGLRIGMGVIHTGGVVGTIHRLSDGFADVLTLADPSSSIDAVIQRSRARGIISGETNSLNCKLKYMDKLEDVTQDDAVVTTNFGDVFPSGLLVGHVSDISSTSNGILQDITVKTAVDLYRIEEVLVVVSSNQPTKNNS